MKQNQVSFAVPSITPVVKSLIIVNLVTWFLAVVVLQKFILNEPLVFQWFGLVPGSFIGDFWVWQLFSYMFLHSDGLFHVGFNMVMLWMFGSELETRMGSRSFLIYYFVCGLGAGLIYLIGTGTYYFFTNNVIPMATPMVGASGAIFGLLLAYGIILGDRVIYFMMIFPMKARFFVMIIAAVEVFSLLSSGFGSTVANLAHLGGLISGFIYWVFWSKKGSGGSSGGPGDGAKKKKRRGSNLRLVVDNETVDSDSSPRYWN